ncbi:SWIM zinc finger family protein [Pedobacter soli]|uniref:SWIM zinc finger n=1 Tax=Pedobacter soli TaxID=390242 RepID=A0A1G7BGK9_9SPHI|nr:SWIM zinc finger family protein [Pedobacter soli]SDE25576.1 SWIM zinc finger [Pedobacter soli]
MQFTHDQILKLAPDDASVKAGKALATSSKWIVAAFNEKALWGDCQGSGKTPYKTIIDLSNLAFKCSCPSRKFPCKHGLGLLFLYASHPSVFSGEKDLVPYVAEWINKRAAKQEEKKPNEDTVVDEKAQQKRVEARAKKVDLGVEELRLWIKDLVRTGIMRIPQNAYDFNKNIAARMVDAQAGGLANNLKRLSSINFYQDGWQKTLIKSLSKTYLLTEAYKNQELLSNELKQEVRSLIGWNTPKEQVLATTGVTDDWFVLSIDITEDNNLRTEKIWMYGKGTKRYALIINFYTAVQVNTNNIVSGNVICAELVFYPSPSPLRALFKGEVQKENSQLLPETQNHIADLFSHVSGLLTVNPFVEEIPFLLSSIKVVFENEAWLLVDADQKTILLSNLEDECWLILSITKGKSFVCFGIYQNEQFNVSSLFINAKYYPVK